MLVNYFNEEEVSSFVTKQLQPDKNIFLDITIIDNGSKNCNVLKMLEDNNANITLIKSEINLGYFGAANLGLSSYLALKKGYPQAVIVCNTDITLQPHFFEVLLQKIETKNFDILGPAIYSSFLKYNQNPYIINRIKKSKLKFLHAVSANYFLYSLFTLYHLLKTKFSGRPSANHSATLKPYAIHGSFMVFNKFFFKKGGTLNYPAVLFGEELFIAEQALQLKLNMVYEPTLKIQHHEHATTGVFKSRKAVAYLHQAYSYLLEAFFTK